MLRSSACVDVAGVGKVAPHETLDPSCELIADLFVDPLPAGSPRWATVDLVPLPPQYHDPDVILALRAAGMRSLNDPQVFLQAAVRSAAIPEIDFSAEARKTALGLAKHLVHNWSSMRWNPTLAQRVSSVAFVPATDLRRSEWPAAPPVASTLRRLDQDRRHLRRERRSNKASRRGGDAVEEEFEALDFDDTSHAGESSFGGAGALVNAIRLIGETANPPLPGTVRVRLVDRSKYCLHANAWLCWRHRLVLPACFDKSTAKLLRVLDLPHPPPFDDICWNVHALSATWVTSEALDEAREARRRGVVLLACAAADRAARQAGLYERDASTSLGVAKTYEVNKAVSAAKSLKHLSWVPPDPRTSSPAFPRLASPSLMCTDLDADLGTRALALPEYLGNYHQLFDLFGAASSNAVSAPRCHIKAPQPHKSLGKAIESSLGEPALADVVFTSGCGTHTTYAHKLVLGLSSPVFRRQFTEGCFAEAVGGRTTIALDEGIPWDGFTAVLRYIYTGALPTSADVASADDRYDVSGGPPRDAELMPTDGGLELALGLLQLADYYELLHLKQWAEAKIAAFEIIDVDNVCDLATHAHAANAEQLLRHVVYYLVELRPIVSETPGWAHLPEAVLEKVDRGG